MNHETTSQPDKTKCGIEKLWIREISHKQVECWSPTSNVFGKKKKVYGMKIEKR